MKPKRRDVLKFAGGGAVGLLFTPVPYKLLDDVSIWSQNWSWIPKLSHGEVTEKFTNCALCPEGCGVRVRCVAGQPFEMGAVAGHPAGGGSLCATGITGHHLVYHPSRVRGVLHDGRPAQLADAVKAIHEAKGTVAFLDARPGRAASEIYRKLSEAIPNARYVVAPSSETGVLEAVARLAGQPEVTYGLDLENTATLVSLGAPVLESWGTPSRIWSRRGEVKLIEVSTRYSATAAQADEWIPLRPGTEAALALALANVVFASGTKQAAFDGLEEFRKLAAAFPPAEAEKTTGIPADRITRLAHELTEGAPAVVVGGGDPVSGPLGDEEEAAIAALNLLIGSVGEKGGYLARRQAAGPANHGIAELPDNSIGALVVDAAPGGDATPWDVIRKKLAPNAVVVCLSAFRTGFARRAGYIVPTPAYLETMEAAGTPCDATRATFSLSEAVMPAPEFAVPADQFAAKLAEAFGVAAPGTIEEILKARAEAIHAAKRGTLFSPADGSSKPVSEVESADALWTALGQGACWQDEAPVETPVAHPHLPEGERLRTVAAGRLPADASLPLAMVPFGDRAATGADALSPLLTKLYQESALRVESNQVLIHPETGKARGLSDGCLAELRTGCGVCRVRVHFAPSVMPDVLEAAVGPSRAELAGDGEGPSPRVIDVCSANGPWRVTPANLVRV